MKVQILFTALIVFLMGCSGERTLIRGSFISDDGVSLRKIKIQVSLVNPQSGKNYSYYTNLDSKGGFSIPVHQDGEHYLAISVAGFSGQGDFPQIAGELDLNLYDLVPKSTIDIGELYLLNKVTVSCPTPSSIIDSSHNLFFEWRVIPFATFYDLNIFKLEEESSHSVVSTHHLKVNSIRFAEIRKFELIKEAIAFDELKALPAFNRQFSDLVPGKYSIQIISYKELPNKQKTLRLSQSERISFSISEE